jgi:phosphomannomutase / phosphoglucomutase
MPVAPSQTVKPNTYDYEQQSLVKATGFREYDARWQFGSEINLSGFHDLGLCLATMMHSRGVRPHIVVGHDYRSYSSSIKYALVSGLLAGGVHVHDIGLCTTPMAYFAQFDLDVPAVAMVTASHNENGWTGVKMGFDRPLTFGPEDMSELKRLVLEGRGEPRSAGGFSRVPDVFPRYKADLLKPGILQRKLRVATVCGNGTAGPFAPAVLREVGCDVLEIDCNLDYTFPNYNPNPEDWKMLDVMEQTAKREKLDVVFGFDGDGDRCGVADNEGRVIYSDKIGLMMARDIAAQVPNATFVVDVKSTGLFATDPELARHGAKTDYYKTGHSYIKRRTRDLDAVAGFEKSGHFFFRPPFGNGYDDGLVSALSVCRMLDRAGDKSLADLYRALPVSHTSPSMSPHCNDELKYAVIEKTVAVIKADAASRRLIAGQSIININTVNGIRFTFTDGSWGIVRASSNKPELVVVCESMTSQAHMRDIFLYVQGILNKYPEVGDFNQTI